MLDELPASAFDAGSRTRSSHPRRSSVETYPRTN